MPATSSTATTARLGTWRSCLRGLRLAAHITAGFGVLGILPFAGDRAGRLAGWWYRRYLHIMEIHVRVTGQMPRGACLVAANHVSWLDIIVLGGLLDAVFVSKAEVGEWPVIGRFARHTGTVFLPRGAGRTREATQRLASALGRGRNVVLFPEATTNAELLPSRFHPRLFAAAIEAEIPVQPVAIRYRPENGESGHHPLAPWVGEANLPTHFRRLFRQPRLQVDVTFCEALDPADRARRDLSETSREHIRQALVKAGDA